MPNAECGNRDLKNRTKQFALRVIRLCETLPRNRTADVLGGQLMRCGTAVGANYRAACRAKSPADFISKMGTVEEECDESIYWMELLVYAGVIQEPCVKDLMDEAEQLLAITVTSIKTARSHRK